jgi:hypothetical protein
MQYLKKLTLTTLLSLALSPAYAAMISTPQFTAEPERAQLNSVSVQRQQVKQQLIEHGVDPVAATERVRHMTDQQISSLQGELATLPAGAAVGTTELLLIIILVILLL